MVIDFNIRVKNKLGILLGYNKVTLLSNKGDIDEVQLVVRTSSHLLHTLLNL